jgi:hypothetical protein
VLIAFLIMLLYGPSGGATGQLGELTLKHLEHEVKAAIPDEARRDLALQALSRTRDAIEDLNERRQKDLGAFEKLVQDYGSRPADFDRLFEAGSADQLRRVDVIWARRAALLQHVRPEEWNAIIQGARAAAAKGATKASPGK